MSKIIKRVLTLVMGVALLVSFAGCGGNKQVFPEKEIRVIVAFSAGGQTDLIARKLGEIIQKQKLLPKPIVVVNMPGGNTEDAKDTVKTSKPDGYTLLMHHTSLITTKALGQTKTDFRDYAPVAQLVTQPFLIVARKDAPWKDIKDVIEVAKKEPGKYTIGFAGVGGPGHFALLNFLKESNTIDLFKQVPYAGGAEAITAHLGGHVDLRLSNTGDANRYIKSGQIKPLVFLSKSENEDFKGIIKLNELGLKNELTLRTGLFAPKNTPKEVIDILAKAIEIAVKTDEFGKFAKEQANTAEFLGPKDLNAIYESDEVAIKALAAGIKK